MSDSTTKLFSNMSILVTGACGSVGSELIRQLLAEPSYDPRRVIGVDNNENDLFFMDQSYVTDDRAWFYVADIRDKNSLMRLFDDVDVVFHCAALKHVIMCERSPEQAVLTNITGVQNVIETAKACDVKRVIFTSSDKAVNPTNVMGTSKLMGERLMTAANNNTEAQGPIYASTRFGNVLGSNGSVFPIFYNQIANGGPITLTHKDMTRFVMSIKESVKLIIESALAAKGGEVFITKMPIVRIEDLATAMVKELASRFGHVEESIAMSEIGVKPGEKLFEELMSDEEMRRAIELKDYFCVLPAFRGIYGGIEYDYKNLVSSKVVKPYISSEEASLTIDEICRLLQDYGLLSSQPEMITGRYWPGDKEENR